MRTGMSVPLSLLLFAFFLIPSEVQTQTPKSNEKVTLAQAGSNLTSKVDDLTDELTKQAEKLAKMQSQTTLTNKAVVEARAAFVKLSQQRMDTLLDAQKLLDLAKRTPKADEMKTIEEWLAQRMQLKLPEEVAGPKVVDDPATDKRVKETPKEAEVSVEALATYLTKDAKNEREKARAIFLWISDKVTYDLEGAISQKAERRAPEILRLQYTDCGGYAALFEALAKAAGLEARQVVARRAR
jgi:transglutaminase-like putative cysteine protease